MNDKGRQAEDAGGIEDMTAMAATTALFQPSTMRRLPRQGLEESVRRAKVVGSELAGQVAGDPSELFERDLDDLWLALTPRGRAEFVDQVLAAKDRHVRAWVITSWCLTLIVRSHPDYPTMEAGAGHGTPYSPAELRKALGSQ